MTEWQIEPLAKHHDRTRFSCGQEPLDVFIKTQAGQYEKRRLGRTYVALRPDESQVVGYYTLAASAIAFEHVPNKQKLPKHPVPVALLGRLAVDETVQGQGLGERLLVDALRRCLDLSLSMGLHAVEVHALNDQARAFYLRYGFVELTDDARHLYLPMTTIAAGLGTSS